MDIKKRIRKLEANKPPDGEDSPQLIFLVPGGGEDLPGACLFVGGGSVKQAQGESFEDFEARAERIFKQQQQKIKH